MLQTQESPGAGKTWESCLLLFYPTGRQGASPMYTMERGWIDCADRCRTWKILGPDGTPIAEVTTKIGAVRILALLNGREE